MIRKLESLADRLIDRVLPQETADAACGGCSSSSCTWTCCLIGSATRWKRCCWGGTTGSTCQCNITEYC